MSRYKRLLLTFDAFGTLFTPRETIGKQYVCTFLTVSRHFDLIRETCLGHGNGSSPPVVLAGLILLFETV